MVLISQIGGVKGWATFVSVGDAVAAVRCSDAADFRRSYFFRVMSSLSKLSSR